jgi:hypothetical protein
VLAVVYLVILGTGNRSLEREFLGRSLTTLTGA